MAKQQHLLTFQSQPVRYTYDLVSPNKKKSAFLIWTGENLQRQVRVDDMPYIARGESAQITDSPGSRAKDAF